MNTLEVKVSKKSFGKKVVLENIALESKTGDILGVFGRNGCGKSTLLKIIFGTIKADDVEIKLNSVIIEPENIINSKEIAYLPQDSFLPKGKKVRDIIPLFFTNGDDQDRIFYTPGISKFENNKIGNLSLGQLRYLEIVLIGNLKHSFLMLDEPFSMVEPIYKDSIKDFLNTLKLKKGIILTDHYYNDVLDITTKNILIKDRIQIDIENKTDLMQYGYLNSDE
jgi:ABC-type multidrug transport system ATPase subunit